MRDYCVRMRQGRCAVPGCAAFTSWPCHTAVILSVVLLVLTAYSSMLPNVAGRHFGAVRLTRRAGMGLKGRSCTRAPRCWRGQQARSHQGLAGAPS